MTALHFARNEVAQAGDYKAGDFLLTHRNTTMSRFIRFGQRVRYGKSEYAKYNHAAMIVSDKGDLVEALFHGVEKTHIDKYATRDYTIVKPVAQGVVRVSLKLSGSAPELISHVNEYARASAVRFAESLVGECYGITTIFCIAFGLLTGGNFTFGFDGQSICSGLVARSLERLGYIFPRNPSEMMPADLACAFGVTR